ncbi:MAG: C39 family peptidase [Candidatus Woesebacteria bacterium]
MKGVKKAKPFLILISVVLVVFVAWVGLLYSKYGKQTLLFLAQAPPDIILNYSKGAIEDLMPATSSSNTTLPQQTGANGSVAPAISVPSKHYISVMTHTYQKLNNCGPSTASMAASSVGVTFDQFAAADVLKGSYTDKNVAADELEAFLNTKGLRAVYRINGNKAMIEQLVSQDIPVIVEQWLVKRGNGELVGHYRVVRGYDQQSKLFTTNDSFNGPNFVIPYTQFDEWWRPFTRGYIVVFKPEQTALVQSIMGSDWDQTQNLRNALPVFQSEVQSIGDNYAYFNVGTTADRLKIYPTAKEAYDVALSKAFPEHFLWYQFGPLDTYANIGEYDKVLQMTSELLSQTGEMEEPRYYRGVVYEKQGNTAQARSEFEKALAANPRYLPAKTALEQLH